MPQSQRQRWDSLSGVLCKTGKVNPKLDRYFTPGFAEEFYNKRIGNKTCGEMIEESLEESFLGM